MAPITTFGRESEPDAPAGHRVGLRKRSRDDNVILCARHGRDREWLAAVKKTAIAFVGHQPDPTLRCQAIDLLKILAAEYTSARISWRVDDQQLRLVREIRLDGLGVEGEAAVFVSLHENALRAGVVDHVFVCDPIGNGDEHLVARIEQRLRQVKDGVFATDRNHALGRRIIRAVIGTMPVADRILKVGDAARCSVLSEISVDGRFARVLDIFGCRKIRLTGSEIDDVHAFTAQAVGICRQPSSSRIR